MLALEELANARSQMAERLLVLEQQKVPLLASAKRIDEQKTRVFDQVLTQRGLPPGTPCEIDFKTRRVKLIGGPQPAVAPQEAPAEPQETPPKEEPQEEPEAAPADG